MKNFFEHQEQAKNQSFLLFLLFICGLLSLSSVLVFLGWIGWQFLNHVVIINWHQGFWHWYLLSHLVLMALLVLMTLLKYLTFSKGGHIIAQRLNGRYIPFNTKHPSERQLRNILEEMALAAGIKMPSLYILDNEPGINAFAAGQDQDHAIIAVTAGAVRFLEREELQAVIAHEYSHIVQNDIKKNQQLAALISSLVWLKELGEWICPSHREFGAHFGLGTTRSRTSAAPFFGLLLKLLGAIGTFWGRLMKSAINRQREFLADAAAVQYTRYDAALANALKKVGAHAQASLILHPEAETFSHLFFCQGLGRNFSGWLASHPPLSERIERLDPHWDGLYIRPTEQEWTEPEPVVSNSDSGARTTAESDSDPGFVPISPLASDLNLQPSPIEPKKPEPKPPLDWS